MFEVDQRRTAGGLADAALHLARHLLAGEPTQLIADHGQHPADGESEDEDHHRPHEPTDGGVVAGVDEPSQHHVQDDQLDEQQHSGAHVEHEGADERPSGRMPHHRDGAGHQPRQFADALHASAVATRCPTNSVALCADVSTDGKPVDERVLQLTDRQTLRHHLEPDPPHRTLGADLRHVGLRQAARRRRA